MTVKTKYDIGQEVWFKSHHSHIASAKIISIGVYGNNEYIYVFEHFASRIESVLFPTKEELLKSL